MAILDRADGDIRIFRKHRWNISPIDSGVYVYPQVEENVGWILWSQNILAVWHSGHT